MVEVIKALGNDNATILLVCLVIALGIILFRFAEAWELRGANECHREEGNGRGEAQ